MSRIILLLFCVSTFSASQAQSYKVIADKQMKGIIKPFFDEGQYEFNYNQVKLTASFSTFNKKESVLKSALLKTEAMVKSPKLMFMNQPRQAGNSSNYFLPGYINHCNECDGVLAILKF